MNRLNFFFLALLGLFVMIGCNKETEITQRDYPFLVTKTENLNGNGITLIGEILNDFQLGETYKVGFLLSKFDNTTQNELRIELEEHSGAKSFSINLRTDLAKNVQYTVRAFIELTTTEQIILGSQVLFVSHGSQPLPINVESIIPQHGTDNSKVIFTGTNFGFNPDSIHVYIANQQLLIDSVTNTQVYGRIPPNTPVGEHKLTFKSYGRELEIDGNFEIKRPEISSYSPSHGFDRTIVEIKGNYFGEREGSTVYIHNIPCQIIEFSDSSIILMTPETSFYGATKLFLEVGGKKSIEKDFGVDVQIIESITPLIGKIGTEIQVTGQRFVINGYVPVIKLNGAEATTYNLSETSFSFAVPYVAGDNTISLSVGQKTIQYATNLTIEDSWTSYSSASNLGIQYPLKCQISNKVYFGLGGIDNNADFNPAFWEFDVNTLEWTELQSLPNSDLDKANFYYKFLFEHENKIHLLIDKVNTGTMQHYQYNIEQDSWTRLNDTGVRQFHWALSHDNKIYGATLYGSGGEDPKMYSYDSESDSWIYLYDLPFRPPLFHFNLNGKLFIYPQQIYSSSGSFYELDIEDGVFIPKSGFPGNYWPYHNTENHTFNIVDKGYLIYRSDLNVVWEYHPEIDIWIQHQKFVDNRWNALSFVKDGNIYFGLGEESNIDKSDIWIFEK